MEVPYGSFIRAVFYARNWGKSMRNPEQQFWEREATPNCIYLIQTTLDGISFETESVWASREEAERYLEARNHRYPEGSCRVYGVPCYGLLAEMLYRTGIGI